MKRHTWLVAAALLLAVTAWAEEIEIGFPQYFSAWRPGSQGADGTFAKTKIRGLRCAVIECFTENAWNGCAFAHRALPEECVTGTLKGLKVELFTRDTRMLVVRFTDATGQVFQYRYEVPDKDDFQTVFCEVPQKKPVTGFPPTSIWGGAKDKVVHFPIKSVGLLIDCYKKFCLPDAPGFTHRIYFGSVKLVF